MRGLRNIIKDTKPWTFLSKGKRWASFLLCLLLSLFFWFIIVLDIPGGYTKEYTVPLIMPDIPGKYLVTDSAGYPAKLSVGIRAKGGSLFRYSLRNLFFTPEAFQPRPDTTDMNSRGGILELNIRRLKSQLLHSGALPCSTIELLQDSIEDISLSPSRIFLRYEPLEERDAEVLFGGQVDFGKSANLKLVDTVGIYPKTVHLYGPKSALDSLAKAEGAMVVRTDTSAIKIGDPGRILLPVAVIAGSGLRTVPDSVYVSFVTEELVHTTFTVKDIEIRGLDDRHTLRLLPAEVKVTILVPRTKAGDMTYDPKLYVDASKVLGAALGYRLEVRVGNLPSKAHVEMIQLDPDRLDFILEEKISTLGRKKLGTPDGTLQ